jgi:acyl-coenzyme A thioesterase PaaI-like protein
MNSMLFENSLKPNSFDFTKVIDPSCLFWGHSKFKEILSTDEISRLCSAESHEWLSSLFWGEKVAFLYAQKMEQLAQSDVEKKKVVKTCIREVLDDFSFSQSQDFQIDPILRKFVEIPGFNSFSSSPFRVDGMNLVPRKTSELNEAYEDIVFPKRMEGFNGIVHGGFLSMALDEVMFNSILLNSDTISFTKSLEVKFIIPVKTEKKYRLRGILTTNEKKQAVCLGEVCDENGTVCVSATGYFYKT